MASLPSLEPFEAKLAGLAAADRFTGSVAVTHGDTQVFAGAYGFASRAWRVPATLDTRYDTASITKLFTSVATLQLIERGAFALDTSVTGYLGLEGTAIPPTVTPYHLLTHTSGIADDADEEAGERYEDLFVTSPNYAIQNIADNLPNFAHKPANFAPGEGCRYCNVSYLMLGLMIERATGVSYRDHVVAAVFGPAGMTRSGFFRMDVVAPDIAEAVEPIREGEGDDAPVVGWRRNIYSYPPVGDAAGGAHVTVGDLLAFHRAAVDGKLLGPEFTAALFTPHAVHGPRGDDTYLIGYGFEFLRAPDGSIRRYWKEGVNVGVSGMLRHYPRHDVTLAILGVGENAVWDPITTLDEILT